jgi:hypothetical protein
MKKEKPKMSALDSSLIGLGVSAGLMGTKLGGMMGKMFGLNDEKTPQKLAEEMMAGAVRGILEHFEYKLDEQKRQIERMIEEKIKIEDERDSLKEQLESK